MKLFPLIGGLLLFSSCAHDTDPDPNFYIYLCLGQSNMVGISLPQADDSIVSDRFFYLPSCDDVDRKAGEWKQAIPPLCHAKGGLCPADYFGRTMLEYLPQNCKVGVIVMAVNGASILLFDKDSCQAYINRIPEKWMKREIQKYGDNPYARLISTAKQAQRKGVIKGILLHQGETDATDDSWIHNVNKIYKDLLCDLCLLPDSVPLLVGEAVARDQQGAYQHVNMTIDRIHDYIPTAYPISSRGCTPRSDHLHFSVEGTRRLGYRYGIKMLQTIGYELPDDNDSDLQNMDAETNSERLLVNSHVRKNDNTLIIAAPDGIEKVMIVSFSGETLFDFDFDGQQTVEISLGAFSNEHHLAATIELSTGTTSVIQIDQ